MTTFTFSIPPVSFGEAFENVLGRSPGEADGEVGLYLTWIPSPIGPLLAGATHDGICMLEHSQPSTLASQVAEAGKRLNLPTIAGRNEHLKRLEDELAMYFEGRLQKFTVPLVTPGTPFQQKVWDALAKIPYGEVRSYREIARQLGTPQASRAVGQANGNNRIMIAIPCHRVVNHDGQLGGYAYGLDIKRQLLDLEKGILPSMPTA